jgi:YD repeat-containing protein
MHRSTVSLIIMSFTLFVSIHATQIMAAPTLENKTPTQVSIPGFVEPLIHLAADSYTPLSKPFRAENDHELVRLSHYLEANRNTPWEASIQLNLGLAYYRNGNFSRTFDAFERAWNLSKDHPQPSSKALADRAFGELVRMHARLGHAEQVETSLDNVKKRQFMGPATAAVSGAEEGLWMMRNNPGISYLCGPKALYSLLNWQQPGAEGLSILDAYRSGENGVSLSELGQLAEKADMNVHSLYRVKGIEIPVPSVIHWKVNHYAAIVEKQGDLFHVQDPTFGQDLWLTEETVNDQSSGYFMVPDNLSIADENWQPVAMAQAESVYGQGYTASSDEDRTTPCDQKKSKDPCGVINETGMADYDVHTMLVSLTITDTPLSYSPPKGQPIHFTLTYNQREANQPANFSFGNVGPKWTHNWFTYVEDSPSKPSAVVNRIVAGGGAINYSGYNAANGEYQKGIADKAKLYRVSSDPIVYERRLPDGSKEVYGFSDGATNGVRRIFLTKKIDAKGHGTNLAYDEQLRLLGISDALGRTITFAYENPGNDKLITRITDPFSREAVITYDANGRLSSCNGLINL